MRLIFVHGAFVRDGAWWWAPVARLLAPSGIESTAVFLPSCGEASQPPTGAGPGLADDALAVRADLDELPSGESAIVVAHSYGGMVVTEAAAGHPAVAHLVYISSILPRIGESLAAVTGSFPDPVPVQSAADGSVRLVEDADTDRRFLQDVTDPELIRGVHERLTAQSSAVFGAAVSAAAWEHLPTTYLVCAQDNSTPADVQREHAARAGQQVELPTGHHPMLSRPDLVAEAIRRVA